MRRAPENSPFVPGARVAIVTGRHEPTYREGFVEKVHKNGNFTLKGDANRQQYRPSRSCFSDDKSWSANATGERSWNASHIEIWNEATDKKIAEGIARTSRRTRLRHLQHAFERVKVENATDAMLDAIELALKVDPNP